MQHQRWFTGSHSLAAIAGLLSAAVVVSMLLVTPLTQAQSQPKANYSMKVLYSFAYYNGQAILPNFGVRDAHGNIFGATVWGGTNSIGSVYELDAKGNFTTLHSFSGPDGYLSAALPLLVASGDLYGTANFGGNLSYCGGVGCGTVWKIDTKGNFTVLYEFTGSTNGDGAEPGPALVQDSAGNLYGTTGIGGTGNCPTYFGGCGVVFKIDPTGKETVLYSFKGSPRDGNGPVSTLTMDSAGYLYGTTLWAATTPGYAPI